MANPLWFPKCALTTKVGTANFHAYNQAVDGYNYAPAELLLTPSTRAGLCVHGNLNLADNLTPKATGTADGATTCTTPHPTPQAWATPTT